MSKKCRKSCSAKRINTKVVHIGQVLENVKKPLDIGWKIVNGHAMFVVQARINTKVVHTGQRMENARKALDMRWKVANGLAMFDVLQRINTNIVHTG